MSRPRLFNIDYLKIDNKLSEIFYYSLDNPDSKRVITKVVTKDLMEAEIDFSVLKGVTLEKEEVFSVNLRTRFQGRLRLEK